MKRRNFWYARAFARRLKLANRREWVAFCRGEMPDRGQLPADIPATVDRAYCDEGWLGFGDWLGTGNIASARRQYRPFAEAREFVKSLNLKTGKEWKAFCQGRIRGKGRLPSDIPAGPFKVYKGQGWISWCDWLGSGRIPNRFRSYRSFREAREFARSLKLRNAGEWFRFCKGETDRGTKPVDIPTVPSKIYKDAGWNSWGDWLGTGTTAKQLRKYRPFPEAREFVRTLQLPTVKHWRSYCRGEFPEHKPDDIPSTPQQVYRGKGWNNWLDWLGIMQDRGGDQFTGGSSVETSTRSHS